MATAELIRKYKYLFAIMLASSLFCIYAFSDNLLWWDSAVYLGMGKYMFSSGSAGLWEDVRPLVLSSFLGLSWRIGVNEILAGKILVILFGLGSVALTYLLARRIFNEQTAVISSVMLAFSATFHYFSNQILTDVPSLFFSLLGIFFFIKGKYFGSGVVLAIAFMTRFLHLGVFAVLLLVSTLWLMRAKKAQYSLAKERLIKLASGFCLLFIPYLLLNLLLYSDPILPFTRQVYMSKYTGWPNWFPYPFYFTGLIKENLFSVFSLVGIYFILQRNRGSTENGSHRPIQSMQYFIVVLLAIYFTYFTIIRHKEMRFAITFLPYLYMISAFGLYTLYRLLHRKSRFVAIGLATIAIVSWAGYAYAEISHIFPQESISEFQRYIARDDVKDGIWISNPKFMMYTDKKADELIYYVLFDSKKIPMLINKFAQANHILLDTCDIPCPPWDNVCPAQTQAFISQIESEMAVVYGRFEGECRHYIFAR